MLIIDIVSRITHVLTAITLVGGSLFTLLVLMPAAKELADDAHNQLAASITGRWKRFVHGGVLLFLVTGFYNYFRAIPSHKGDSLYHALVGTKILLALGIFFPSGRSGWSQRKARANSQEPGNMAQGARVACDHRGQHIRVCQSPGDSGRFDPNIGRVDRRVVCGPWPSCERWPTMITRRQQNSS